jgi:hypothetical protein
MDSEQEFSTVYTTEGRDYYCSVCFFVCIGSTPPPPHTTWIHVGGATHLLAVEGVGGANADEGTDTIVLCILAHRTSPLNN